MKRVKPKPMQLVDGTWQPDPSTPYEATVHGALFNAAVYEQRDAAIYAALAPYADNEPSTKEVRR